MSPYGVWPNRRAVKRRSYPSGTRRNSSLTAPPWKNYAPSRHSSSARSLRFWWFSFAGVRLRASAVTTFFHSVVTAGYALPCWPCNSRKRRFRAKGEGSGPPSPTLPPAPLRACGLPAVAAGGQRNPPAPSHGRLGRSAFQRPAGPTPRTQRPPPGGRGRHLGSLRRYLGARSPRSLPARPALSSPAGLARHPGREKPRRRNRLKATPPGRAIARP